MPTVLVVDDEWAIADWLAAVIGDMGHRVLTASNGKMGLDLIKGEHIDLVITDYMMPVLDGLAMVAAMRERPTGENIPVIIMTAIPESTVRKRLDHYRAYLRKPFGEAELIAALHKSLNPNP